MELVICIGYECQYTTWDNDDEIEDIMGVINHHHHHPFLALMARFSAK